MDVYSFSENVLTFFSPCLKQQKKSIQIKHTYSNFQLLLSVVPQGSILGSILFDLLINDLFIYIKNSDLHNFVDGNTIYCISSTLNELISELEKEGNIVTNSGLEKTP